MSELPQAQDTTGQTPSEVPCGVLAGLVFRKAIAQAEPQMGTVVSDAAQSGVFSAAERRELMSVSEARTCRGSIRQAILIIE